VQLPDAAAGGSGVPPPFLDAVNGASPGQVRFDTVLSEEGGRFYHARTRYRLIEVGDEVPVRVPEDFCWMTVSQLMELVGHGHYLNVEARTLLACARSL
jgi:oxidase EvaA